MACSPRREIMRTISTYLFNDGLLNEKNKLLSAAPAIAGKRYAKIEIRWLLVSNQISVCWTDTHQLEIDSKELVGTWNRSYQYQARQWEAVHRPRMSYQYRSRSGKLLNLNFMSP